MIKRLFSKSKATLEEEIDQTDAKLAMLKAQLAAQMIRLARQTQDLVPLSQAETALSEARQFHAFENCPPEIVLVQQALADSFLDLGRLAQDKTAIMRAKTHYRAAITLASMMGDDALRSDMRAKIIIVDSLLGHRPKAPSLFSAA